MVRDLVLIAAVAATAGCRGGSKQPAHAEHIAPTAHAPTVVVTPSPEVRAWDSDNAPTLPALTTRAVAATRPGLDAWRFVVLSDLHVFANGRIPEGATALVKQVARMKPRLVVITGDSTNGNKGDRFSARSIDRWWRSVHTLLQPLYDANIPVLSVAGNHDTYRVKHRAGYAKAWADQTKRAAPLALSFGKTPFYYSVDVGDTHLVLLDIVTQHIDKKQQAWLEADLAASNAKLKLVFGHVPIQSAITRSVRGFRNLMVPLLARHGVQAYIAGHEHLIWDEVVAVGANRLRQVTCGTSSGTYNYGIRPSLVKRHCTNQLCTWPNNGHQFRIRKKSREMWHRTTAMAVDVVNGQSEIRVHPYYLAEDGSLVAFPRSPVADTAPRP